MYGLNTTAAARTYTTTVPTTPQDGATLARFEWKHYNDSIVVFDHEIAMNAGEAQIINLMKFKTAQAEGSLRDIFNAGIFGTGTDGGTAISGFGNLFSASTTAGGLAPGTHDWWKADVNTPSPTSFAANGIEEMRKIFTATKTLSDGSPANAIVTDNDTYNWYEARLFNQVRFQKGDEGLRAIDPAYQHLLFNMTPVFPDKDCTAGYMYFLNTNFLKLAVLQDQLFKVGPFVRPENQRVQVALVNFTGNLITDNRRKLGLINTFVA